MTQLINLRSRRGDGYLVWIVLFAPFAVLLISLALDGLGMAVTYQRAVGLARVAAQAGAGSIDFNGQQPVLNAQACPIALDTVAQSSAHTSANGGDFRVNCVVTGNTLIVTVRLKVLRILGGPLGAPFTEVVAQAKAAPRFGINQEE